MILALGATLTSADGDTAESPSAGVARVAILPVTAAGAAAAKAACRRAAEGVATRRALRTSPLPSYHQPVVTLLSVLTNFGDLRRHHRPFLQQRLGRLAEVRGGEQIHSADSR